MTEISNADELIDSREVIERIAELEGIVLRAPDDDDELDALRALTDEASDYADDWADGVTLVRDSYFKEYAQEYAEDIGAINAEVAWPYSCVDWDRAADELRMDYTAVEYDGVTYWVR